MYLVFLHTRLRPTCFSFPTLIKKTIIQPSEAEMQTMMMIELCWLTMHLPPSSIPYLSWTKNEVLQHNSKSCHSCNWVNFFILAPSLSFSTSARQFRGSSATTGREY
jgi:hypothetical protein